MIPLSRFKSAEPSLSWLLDELHEEGVLDAQQHQRMRASLVRQRSAALKRMGRVDLLAGEIERQTTPMWRRAHRRLRAFRVRVALWRLDRRARRQGDPDAAWLRAVGQ